MTDSTPDLWQTVYDAVTTHDSRRAACSGGDATVRKPPDSDAARSDTGAAASGRTQRSGTNRGPGGEPSSSGPRRPKLLSSAPGRNPRNAATPPTTPVLRRRDADERP